MRVNSLTHIALFVALFTIMQLNVSMASEQQLLDMNEFSAPTLIENHWLELPGGFESLEPGRILFTTFPPGTFQSSTDNQGIAITVDPGQVAFLYAANPIRTNGQPVLLRMTLRASSPWASVAFIAFSGDLSTGADVDGSMGLQFPASSVDFVESEKRMVLVYEPNHTGVLNPAIQVAGFGDETCTVWIDRLEVLSLDAESFGSDPGVPSVVEPTPTPTMTPLPPEPTPTPTPEPAPINPLIPVLAREVSHFEYGALNALAYSPDAQSILTGGSDGFARLWDIETGLVMRTFDRHRNAVRSVAFSPDASLVLTGGADGLAKLWNAASGELIHSLEGHHSVIYSVGFSSDGAQIVTASGDRTVKLWDASSGDLIRTYEGHEGAVRSAALSPDGMQILTGGDITARLWEVTSGDLIRVFDGHTNFIHAVGFSPDGTQIVTGSADHTAKVWDIVSGEEILAFTGHENQVFSAAFSPDGTSVVSGSGDRTTKLWDTATGEEIASFNAITMGSAEPRYQAVLSPDGSRVLAGGSRSNTPALWDVSTGELVNIFGGHSNIVASVALSPDGSSVLTASFDYDYSARLWDALSGELVREFVGHTSPVTVAAFSPDGTRIVTGSGDQTAKLWNTSNGDLIHTFNSEGHSNIVGAAAISPNGEYLLTGSDDRTAKMWNANSGGLIHTLEGHTARISAVAFSPDGSQFLTASDDRSAKLWDAASGELIYTFSDQSNYVVSLAFTQEEAYVFTVNDDNTVIWWNAATGEEILSFTGHTSRILATEFSQDGTQIITGGFDRTVRAWDAENGELVRTYYLKEYVDNFSSMAFSPDASQVLTGSGGIIGGTAKLWDISSVDVPAPLPQDPEIVPLPEDSVRISLNLAIGDTPLDMAYIPAGEFLMGSPEDDASSYPPEYPQHSVTLSRPYYMGIYPITQAQYEAVMGENPSSNLGPNLPVEMVSWEDAVRFCNRLSELLGLELAYNEETWEAVWSANGVRLPTEAEWEYAVRAGTTSRFYWGDDPEYAEIDLYAWRFGNYRSGENVVGQKLPNAWGLFDMSGNVWEWCYDWMGEYSEDDKVDPTGPETGIYRVCRGGSIKYSPLDCRSAQRRPEDPSTGRDDRGFRVVLPFSP